jgi:hypothetical protein
MQSFIILRQLLAITPPLSAQLVHSAGGRGGPQILFLIGILIFLLLRSLCQISKPYDNPFWEKSNNGRKKEEERRKKED